MTWRIATDEDVREESAAVKAEYGRVIALVNNMARVLLAVEWSHRGRGDRHECPSCSGEEWAADAPWTGHDATCPLDAALRKAGVR